MGELFLIAIFIVTSGISLALVLRKIPLLLQIPPQLINESFVTRPNRLKEFSDAVIEFFRHAHYWDWYYRVLIWSLRRLRVSLLRLERTTYRFLERIETRGQSANGNNGRYWDELKGLRNSQRQSGNGTVSSNAAMPTSRNESNRPE